MATTPGHFLSGKRIIVAGGGIAGSTFVSALDQLWDPFLPRPQITVLERETREASIEQDHYMLSINGGHVDEGLAALKYLGLLGDVRAGATLNSGAIWPWGNLPAATIRITRADLKRVLLEKAEKAEKCTWQWACTVIGAEQLPNGQIRVTISNNAIPSSTSSTLSQDCDPLIAADGADSRIKANLRPQDLKLEYAGASQIGGISHFPNGVPHPVHEDYGLQMSSGEGVCCIYTPFDNYTVGWALSKMGPERAAKTTFTIEEFTALKEEALKFGSIVETTDPTTAFIRLAKEKMPFTHDARLRGIVFIGDANRMLNCYTLDGANLALKDGWDLAEQICRHRSLEIAVAGYDKIAVARAEHVLHFSRERIRFGHSMGLMWKVYKYGMKAQKKMGKK